MPCSITKLLLGVFPLDIRCGCLQLLNNLQLIFRLAGILCLRGQCAGYYSNQFKRGTHRRKQGKLRTTANSTLARMAAQMPSSPAPCHTPSLPDLDSSITSVYLRITQTTLKPQSTDVVEIARGRIATPYRHIACSKPRSSAERATRQVGLAYFVWASLHKPASNCMSAICFNARAGALLRIIFCSSWSAMRSKLARNILSVGEDISASFFCIYHGRKPMLT